jgi:hypothetical protein
LSDDNAVQWSAQSGLDLESLSLLTAALLLLALILLLGTLAWSMLGARAMDLQFVVRVGSPTGQRHTGLRASFLAAMGSFAATLAWMGSQGLGPGPRFSVAGGAVVVVVGLAHLVWQRLAQASTRQQIEATLRQRQAAETFHALRANFDRTALLETAARHISSALNVHPLLIFLERDGQYRVHHALGDSLASDLVFSAGSNLIQHLSRPSSGSALTLSPESDDTPSFLFSPPSELAETDGLRLAAVDLRLIVPVRQGLRLAGLLALGPRAGRVPYSAQDLRYLERVAGELAVCLEWSVTVSAYATVQAELAREEGEHDFRRAAKNRLFEGDAGVVPGFEYAGAWAATGSPELESYSFFPLPDQGIGMLLASARGDGPEWALAIADLRGWVRGRSDLGTRELQRELDRRRHSPGGDLLRVFYARYEPRTQQLRFVNSGYPAPFVLRRTREGAQILRLGPGNGNSEAPIIEGNFGLCPADLIVAASRGLVEAANPQGDRWGEGSLIETLLSWESQPVADIAHLALRTAQGFAASAAGFDQAIVVLRPLKPGAPAAD